MMFTRTHTRFLLPALQSLALILSSTHFAQAQRSRKAEDQAVAPSVVSANDPAAGDAGIKIRWRARPGIDRYRLQLALDNAFNDIVFDRAVIGNEHWLTELPPGRYFWRVAPATTETEAYTTVGVVNVTTAEAAVLVPEERSLPERTPEVKLPEEKVLEAVVPRGTVATSPLNTGWSTATGEVMSLGVANFNASSPTMILAVNSEGTTYALDARRGVALWVARREEKKRDETNGNAEPIGFVPLTVSGASAEASSDRAGIVIASSEGVRLVESASGRELWRATFDGRPLSGVIADADADGAPEVIVAAKNPERLYFIDVRTGRVERQIKLDGTPTGAPIVFGGNSKIEVLLALDSGRIAIFNNRDDDAARSVKLDTRITAAPLIVENASGARLLVGTERGLIALRFSDLSPLWRIATEDEPPRGTLAGVDLDGDKEAEAVMLTRKGRVAVVDVGRGEIRWVADGATDAAFAAFADLNRDGSLDVIVPGARQFAVAYSGRDGKPVWSTDDPTAGARQGETTTVPRPMLITPVRDERGAVNGIMLVGSDPQRIAVRAVRLSRSVPIAAAGASGKM